MRIDADKIITQGNIDFLIESAEEIGTRIARQVSTSQIRNIFGEVRRIEAIWPPFRDEWTVSETSNAQTAYRATVLLRPKLAYQAQKEKGQGIRDLRDALDPCIQVIQSAETEQLRRLYFTRFVDFFEAILAYHKAGGGN